MKRLSSFLIAGLFLGGLIPGQADAAMGDLDLSFSQDGKATLDLGTDQDTAYAVVIDASGRAVTAGCSDKKFTVARFNGNGSPDMTFGSGGKVTTSFGMNDNCFDAVIIDGNDRILAAGNASVDGKAHFALVRYLPDGTVDVGFGDNGKVTTAFAGNAYAADVVVQPDGKIVAVGQVYNPSMREFGLVRYNTDGSLDASFGSGGLVSTSLGPLDDVANAVALQADGKIVVAGSSQISVGPVDFDFAVARYNTDGSLDAGFGTGGFVITPMSNAGVDHGTSVALQGDKIVVGGRAASKFGVARYNADGSPDNNFSADGKVTTTIGPSSASITDLFVESDGKIVAAGKTGITGDADFALARYDADGTLLYSFSGLNPEPSTWAGKGFTPTAAAAQPDKKLVVVGTLETQAGKDFAVARFVGGGTGGGLIFKVNPGIIGLLKKADLALGITASPNPVAKNNNLTLIFTVKNNGTATANNAALTYSLPANVSFVSAPNCSGTATVTCGLGTITSGQTKTRQITVMPTKKKTGQVHTATVAASGTDKNPADNTKSVTVNVTD